MAKIEMLTSAFPGLAIESATDIVNAVRKRKSPEEVI